MDTNLKTTVHSRKNIIIAIVAILILVGGVVYAINYQKNKKTNISGMPLTQAQKKQIIDTLSHQTAPSVPLTTKEQTAIIQSLSRQSAPVKPLTDEEKTAIIQSLSH
jgi:uncharacterized membrane protein